MFTKIRNYLYSIQITHREEEMGREKYKYTGLRGGTKKDESNYLSFLPLENVWQIFIVLKEYIFLKKSLLIMKCYSASMFKNVRMLEKLN